MQKREKILNRFDNTKINYLEMDVIPETLGSDYNFKNKDGEAKVVNKINKNFR